MRQFRETVSFSKIENERCEKEKVNAIVQYYVPAS